jgi:peptidoglycan hydrolase-like protein with peptidoglycan-binding domain
MALGAGRFSVNPRLQSASNNSPSMKQGEKGVAVAIVQQALVDLGFAMPLTTNNRRSLTDGIFGAETVRVVIQFQKTFGLVADGVVGRQTLAKLDELIIAQSVVQRSQDQALAARENRGGTAQALA